jgi:hypothetical protein
LFYEEELLNLVPLYGVPENARICPKGYPYLAQDIPVIPMIVFVVVLTNEYNAKKQALASNRKAQVLG